MRKETILGLILGLFLGQYFLACNVQKPRVIKELRQDPDEAVQWLIDCKNDVLSSDMDDKSKSFYIKDCQRTAKEVAFYSMTLIITKHDTILCEDLPPRKRLKYCGK